MQTATSETIPASSGKNSGRIAYIDLMETLAMVFVVAYHLSNCRYKFLYEPGMEATVNYYLRGFFVCCVPLFLITNGFLMFRRSFDLRRHLIKTLRYALVTLFWGVVTLLEYDYFNGVSLGASSFLEDLQTWRGGVIHLWYMGALVIIYLLFPILKLVHDQDRKLLVYVIVMTAVFTFGNQILNYALTIFYSFRGVEQTWAQRINWFSMFNPVTGIPAFTLVYFCLGAFLEDFLHWLERFPRKRINLLTILGLLVAGLLHSGLFVLLWRAIPYYYCPIWYGYETVTGALITLGVLVLCTNCQGRNARGAKLLKWVSVNTLGIYFLHMVVINPFLEQLPTVGFLYNLPGNLLCAAAVTVFCGLITVGLRKIPGIKWLVS